MLRRANLDRPPERNKPAWLRVRAPGGDNYVRIKGSVQKGGLHTVCEEARCPNIGECWSGGTATFMLLGDTCTRACGFCAVKTGNPRGLIDRDEPAKIAETVAAMKLTYVVLTTVDRDDLEDGGAAHFAETIRSLRERCPGLLVEVLAGDFQGNETALSVMLEAAPDVYAHNVETVERLTPNVRDPRASYRQSLDVLGRAKELRPEQITKSSIMIGLGEAESEVIGTMRDLRGRGVDVLTLGQYLRPTPKHLPVEEFVEPERFDRMRELGLELGFRYIASGPLVRSSYRAGEHFIENVLRGEREATGTVESDRT